MATYYKHDNDKKSGDGLAISEWNTLSSALAGNSGLHLALAEGDNVGIGTKKPLGPLSIGDSSENGSDGFLVIGKKHKSGGSRHFRMGFDANFNFTLGDYGNNNQAGTWKKPFAIHWDAPDSSFYIDKSGKINVDKSLEAKGNVTAEALIGKVVRLSAGNSANNGILFASNPGGGASDRAWLRYYAQSGEHTVLEIGVANDAHDHIALMPSGNVGIGTTSPKQALEVKGNVKATKFIGDGSGLTNLRLGNASLEPENIISVNYAAHFSADSRKFIEFKTNYRDDNSRGQVFLYAPTNYYTNKPAITLAGNYGAGGMVGIGTTSPDDTLHVHGNLRLSRSDNHFRMYVESKKLVFKIDQSSHGSNKVMSWDGDTNWDSSSDRRLKTNIVQEMDILPRLMQLSVKNFNWKDTPNRKLKSIGFIAQDVKPLFPALVGEIENEETKETTLTLKYASFGVLAVGAIKEMKQEYDQRIAALEKEIVGLKTDLGVIN